MDPIPILSHNSRLETLHARLNYEIPGMILFAVSFFYKLAFYLFLPVALVFTPYMLTVLFSEGRYGWILIFVVLVLLPTAGIYIVMADMPGAMGSIGYLPAGSGMLTDTLPIGLYILYCYLLKVSLPAMIDSQRTRTASARQEQ